ncbi:MAG: hypothetical protein RLZZ262_2001 [Bacteroidota bacterium]|jgi:hypothetical protein
MKCLIATSVFTLSSILSIGQNDHYVILDTLTTPEYVAVWYTKNGETEVTATHAPIVVKGNFKNKRQQSAYTKLQKKLIKVYPYARAAGDVMRQYEALCVGITDEKQKKALLNKAEERMKAQFEKDLRSLTVSEGVILIKLIDRETGKSSFSLVSELKGKMSAYMWQGLARVFGHNLKDTYEAEGEDVWMENIIASIEDGTIPVKWREVKPF